MTVTHEVTNQAVPRVGINEYTANVALGEAISRYEAQWAHEELAAVGAHVGREKFQVDADQTNRYPPVFASHDRYGHRVDAIDFHPAYHRIIGAAVAHGAHTSCWTRPRPGAHVARAATFMLFAQIESGHSCPVSMTHAVVPSLRVDPSLADVWLPRVFNREYDPRLGDPNKASAMFGMAMTEKQGGSDVRANTTRAVPVGDGTYRITGHKWFCSAPQSDAFLVLAQTANRLSCFVVPRILPDGSRNIFNIQRLKDKLGNKSNASSEIEFENTVGWLLGDEGAGVKTIIEMVNQTRLDCVLGSTAGMRQAVAEAAWHARHRSAFGATLIDQPAMSAVIADLHLDAEAATWTALRLAAAYDTDDAESVAFRRLATAVSKYWVCKRAVGHAYEALECLGGNGYTETFPLARRFREQPVMAVWEGSGNVIALDVLRAIARDPQSVDAVDREVARALGHHREFDAHVTSTRALIAQATSDPAAAQPIARQLVESLALAIQGSILIREAPSAIADGFISARLGSDRTLLYGALPPGLNLAAILART